MLVQSFLGLVPVLGNLGESVNRKQSPIKSSNSNTRLGEGVIEGAYEVEEVLTYYTDEENVLTETTVQVLVMQSCIL